MNNEQLYEEIVHLKDRINDINQRLSDFTEIKVDAITPYKDTKTAYIGDTEIIFYDVPESGNVTVFFNASYNMERIADRITLTFEPLADITEITISIV